MKYKILKKDPIFQNDKDIFQLGKRDGNTKRNFLFLSKWIGKHLECKPSDFTKIVIELSKKINTDFDTPLLSMGNEKGLIPIAPKHGEISGNLPITERSGPAAADDILTFVEQKFYM